MTCLFTSLKSKMSLFLPNICIETVKGLTTVGLMLTSYIQPFFKRSKTASVTKSELSNADLLLFLNIEQGVETNGIE